MNRVNPAHIAILLLAFMAFFTFKLSGAKAELANEQALYQETLDVSTQLKGLILAYGDKDSVKKSIKRVLDQSSLKSANIEEKTSASGVVLSAPSLDKIALDSLLSKILNGSYNVASLEIKRINDERASLEMEIKW
jgi:CRISPR/Cas system-associated protein Csx1